MSRHLRTLILLAGCLVLALDVVTLGYAFTRGGGTHLEKLGLKGARIAKQDARRALAAETAAGSRYDLVLVDPPYRMFDSFQPTLAAYLPALLAEDGLVVVETDKRTEPELPLAQRTSRTYGSARLTLFE